MTIENKITEQDAATEQPDVSDRGTSASQDVPSPELVLRQGLKAMHELDIDLGRRCLEYLEKATPEFPGVDYLRQRIEEYETRAKRESNVRAAEEMLLGYIQQRKKALASLALETLLELVPDHPRKAEYEIWIGDLDQEVAFQERIQNHLRDGRKALQLDLLDDAAGHVEALQKLDPGAPATTNLAEELEQARRDLDEGRDIDRLKKGLEVHLEKGEIEQALKDLERLSQLDVPKITLDFLRQHVSARQNELRRKAEMEQFEEVFNQRLQSHDWVGAREIADMFAERFPTSPRSAELYDKVNGLDAADRREQSKQQGIAALERYIEAGQQAEARLALQVLRNLDIDPQVLATLDARVRQL